jgi:hypothetical protein
MTCNAQDIFRGSDLCRASCQESPLCQERRGRSPWFKYPWSRNPLRDHQIEPLWVLGRPAREPPDITPNRSCTRLKLSSRPTMHYIDPHCVPCKDCLYGDAWCMLNVNLNTVCLRKRQTRGSRDPSKFAGWCHPCPLHNGETVLLLF